MALGPVLRRERRCAMASMIMPDYAIDRAVQVTPALLGSMGVRAVLLDVDSTLSAPQSQVPYAGSVEWVRTLRAQGFAMMIISNNFKRRVAPFAALYGLPYLCFACKPLPFAYFRALRRMRVKAGQAVVIGDQVFTDILGANLVGLHSILLTPQERGGTASFLRRRSKEEQVRRKVRQLGRYIGADDLSKKRE